MKRFLYTVILLLVGTLVIRITEADDFSSELYRLWQINVPNVTLLQSNNTIVVDYGISEQLTLNNIHTNIFTEDCEGPGLSEGILEDTLDANTGAHVFQIDPFVLAQNEEVFEPHYFNNTASMKMCLRYSLWSPKNSDDSDLIEINYIYNILTIYFNLTADFSLCGFQFTIPDEEKKPLEPGFIVAEAVERHRADVYLCDPDTHERRSPPVDGYGVGDVLSICVEATQALIDDNMYIAGIKNFKWTREYLQNGVPTTADQWAVKDGVPDALSTYWCPWNALLCTFTTMLIADFFTTPGSVSGYGNADVGFGSRPNRNLVHEKPTTNFLRSVQEESKQESSNLAISIPLKGLNDGVLDVEEQIPTIEAVGNTSLWLAVAAVLVSALSLGAYVWWMYDIVGDGAAAVAAAKKRLHI